MWQPQVIRTKKEPCLEAHKLGSCRCRAMNGWGTKGSEGFGGWKRRSVSMGVIGQFVRGVQQDTCSKGLDEEDEVR